MAIFNFTESDDIYRNTAYNTILSALGGNDTVKNYAKNVIIYGGKGNDKLDNWSHGKVAIYGEEGNDNLMTAAVTEPLTLSGGGGDDRIYSGAKKTSISGDSGSDTIYGWGILSTITGGSNNDKIVLYDDGKWESAHLIQYHSGDGDDIVYGFNSDDTLEIISSNYSTLTSGNDLIVTVGDGHITLVGVTSTNIKRTRNVNSGGLKFTNNISDTIINGTAYADDILNNGSNVVINGLAKFTIQNEREPE